jgi:hypothetical protein
MSRKTTLPWDLEHAMTAFQVEPGWYENYWLALEEAPGLRSGILAWLIAPFRRNGPTKAHDLLPNVISGFGFGDISRHPDGSIDVHYYRRNAALERQQARQQVLVFFAAHLTRMRPFVTSKLHSLTRPLSRAEQPSSFKLERFLEL